MIAINELYSRFNSAYNTSQFGICRPVTDFVPAVHEISMELFRKLVAVASTNQQVQDYLMPFRKTINIVVEQRPDSAFVAKPKDYENFAASRIVMQDRSVVCEPGCDLLKDGECVPFDDIAEDFRPADSVKRVQYPVRLIVGNKWAAFTTHVTKGPSLHSLPPRVGIRQIVEGFEVEPAGVGVIVMEYYRKPSKPIFNYSVVETGPDVFLEYKEAGSEHLEWSETLLDVFIYKLGKRYALTIQNQLLLSVRSIDPIFE